VSAVVFTHSHVDHFGGALGVVSAEEAAALKAMLERVYRNVAALEEIADNELSLERYDRAEIAASQAIDMDAASYTGHYIMGFIRSHQGRWDEAHACLTLANKLKPNNPEILRCLGWVLFNMDKKPQGVVTLERSLNLDSDNTLTLCDLGVAYLELRNFQKSRALFVRTLDLDPMNLRARECIAAIDRIESQMADKTQKIV